MNACFLCTTPPANEQNLSVSLRLLVQCALSPAAVRAVCLQAAGMKLAVCFFFDLPRKLEKFLGVWVRKNEKKMILCISE